MATPAAPFIVFALPRSRTKWLSEFLGQSPARVEHDLALQCGSIGEFIERLYQLDGTVETGAMYGWRLVRGWVPDVRVAVVYRPLLEIHHSLLRLGINVQLEELAEKWAMLRELSRQPGVVTCDFRRFPDTELLMALYRFCRGEPCQRQWLNGMLYTNIQIDMDKRLAYLIEHRDRIARFKAEVLREVAAYGQT